MSQCVVDASVALAWVNRLQATSNTDELLEQVANGTTIVVPPLWFLEVANALLVLERRKKLTDQQRRESLKILSEFNLSIDDSSPRIAFSTTGELANTHGLSVYDASYLEISLRRRIPLASRDEQLRHAAKKAGADLVF